MVPPTDAFTTLVEGNRRFVAGQSAELHRTHKLVDNQTPFAIVVGCSDSRVPPEIVFDQGVGDMFVIRIAGNIVTPLELGSIEFAAIKFGPRLVVVLGHSCCGAVQATIETLESGSDAAVDDLSAGMQTIVEHIGESVESTDTVSDPQAVERVVRANVRNSVDWIRNGSSVLRWLIDDEGMEVVGAYYDLDTGRVHFDDY